MGFNVFYFCGCRRSTTQKSVKSKLTTSALTRCTAKDVVDAQHHLSGLGSRRNDSRFRFERLDHTHVARIRQLAVVQVQARGRVAVGVRCSQTRDEL